MEGEMGWMESAVKMKEEGEVGLREAEEEREGVRGSGVLEALISSIEREKIGKSRGDTKRSSEEEKEMGRIKENGKLQILRILLRFKLAGLVKLKEGREENEKERDEREEDREQN
ncbi:hypothetical protein BLNAU_23545 [Blattamonas nauphoetae]|uniref:Uncharacterized protein n=1 Tax=Blattamonas nauphoetae TaxID=2049346 RepID=A0ABQ9WQB4_9EUKA|nr:hypothetical protein BLNAU_23545 [Blattamonas nauphoetae]